MTPRKLFFLYFTVVLLAVPDTQTYAGNPQNVVCQAARGYHCDEKNGCISDATYITTYRVDLENGTVDEVSVQHTKRDKMVKPGSAKYQIVNIFDISIISNERSITAVGKPGLAATETILLGEKSYLSSSVSSFGMRIFVMIGSCEGLKLGSK